MSLLENNLPSLKSDNVFKKYWGYINTFFRTQGFYQPNIYKFTSAFCNALLHNSRIMRENIDGILYTSLQDTSGWNLAISSKFVDENLRDTKHNKKANTVFLKLLAKQKSKRRANPWGVVRSETYPIAKEIKPGVDDV